MKQDFIISKDGRKLYGFGKSFYNEDIIIPEGIEYIEYNGVSSNKPQCPNKIILPKSLRGIYGRLLSEWGVKEVEFLNEDHVHISPFSFSGNDELVKVTLPKHQKYLKDYVFNNCVNLEEVVNTKNITHLEKYVFKNCRKLKGFNWTGVYSLGDGAFYNCRSLELRDLDLSSLEVINPYTFAGCSSEFMRLPSTLRVIEPFGFANSDVNIKAPISGAKPIFEGYSNIPAKLYIRQYAFAGSNISYLQFPEYGDYTVENYAFDSCNNLQYIVLTSVVKCAENAFSNISTDVHVEWELGRHGTVMENIRMKNNYCTFTRKNILYGKELNKSIINANRQKTQYLVQDYMRRNNLDGLLAKTGATMRYFTVTWKDTIKEVIKEVRDK